jgi:preprotein translocase SecE subunit
MNSFISYLKNVRAEMTHVVFPTRKALIGHTVAIILISVFVAFLLTGLDLGFTKGVEFLISQ